VFTTRNALGFTARMPAGTGVFRRLAYDSTAADTSGWPPLMSGLLQWRAGSLYEGTLAGKREIGSALQQLLRCTSQGIPYKQCAGQKPESRTCCAMSYTGYGSSMPTCAMATPHPLLSCARFYIDEDSWQILAVTARQGMESMIRAWQESHHQLLRRAMFGAPWRRSTI